MRTFRAGWSLCGGWAVDAWVGRQTREHRDLDLAVFREDERAVFEHLTDWHLVGHDTPDADHSDAWDGRALDFPAHIHATSRDGFKLEFQLNERSGLDWILSREPKITLPLARAAGQSAWGLPTMGPEALLFYKSTDTRPRDQADFQALCPHLTDEERDWLATSISLVDVNHPWLTALRRDLERFVVAQQDVYRQVVEELRRGRKTGHWMWFIFPQLAGLGQSTMSRRFAIASLDEARAYLAHPVLGPRLRECAALVAASAAPTAEEMFGGIDAKKLRSCMTLFHRASPDDPVFARVLARYYGGVADPATDALLGRGGA